MSATGYLEKGSLRFTNVINLELTAKPAVINNSGQIVMNFEEEVVKKKNECAAKKKERLIKLRILVRSLLSFDLKSSLLLLLYSLPTPIPAFVLVFVLVLMPAPIFILLFCSRSPIIWSSGCMPTLATVSYCRISVLLLLLSVFSPPLLLGPSSLRIFK